MIEGFGLILCGAVVGAITGFLGSIQKYIIIEIILGLVVAFNSKDERTVINLILVYFGGVCGYCGFNMFIGGIDSLTIKNVILSSIIMILLGFGVNKIKFGDTIYKILGVALIFIMFTLLYYFVGI